MPVGSMSHNPTENLQFVLTLNNWPGGYRD
jgi:hypothetical protein